MRDRGRVFPNSGRRPSRSSSEGRSPGQEASVQDLSSGPKARPIVCPAFLRAEGPAGRPAKGEALDKRQASKTFPQGRRPGRSSARPSSGPKARPVVCPAFDRAEGPAGRLPGLPQGRRPSRSSSEGRSPGQEASVQDLSSGPKAQPVVCPGLPQGRRPGRSSSEGRSPGQEASVQDLSSGPKARPVVQRRAKPWTKGKRPRPFLRAEGPAGRLPGLRPNGKMTCRAFGPSE